MIERMRRRLAGTVAADESDEGARRNREDDIGEHRRPRDLYGQMGDVERAAHVRSCRPAMQFRSDDVAPHVGVREHGGRRSVRNDPALVECNHAGRVTLDDLHVMLDEEHRRALCGDPSITSPSAEILLALMPLVSSSSSSVGPADHRERDVEQLALLLRQLRHRTIGSGRDLEACENVAGRAGVRSGAAGGGRCPRRRRAQ